MGKERAGKQPSGQDLAKQVKGPVVSGDQAESPHELGAPEYYAKDQKPKVATPGKAPRR